MSTLSGCVVATVREVNDGDVFLDLVNGRAIQFHLDADCCSSSYFPEQSLEVLREFVGDELVSIEHVGSERTDQPDDAEVTSWHALLIRSNKRSNTVDWRNDSNGYYDGTCTVLLDGKELP